jgi:hypothetical protein
MGLVVIIAIGFVFTLGSSLAIVELGTGNRSTFCSAGVGTAGRSVCTTGGGTSPVVYVILVVAIVIGVICLAAGITVLAVRISATPSATTLQGGWFQQPQPGSPQVWWDGTRWVMSGSPPTL